MKKIFYIFLTICVICMSFSACTNSQIPELENSPPQIDVPAPTETPENSETPVVPTKRPGSSGGSGGGGSSGSANPTPEEPKPSDPPTTPEEPVDPEGVKEMILTINGKRFVAEFDDTAAAKAFSAMLPLTIEMGELNGNEKYHYLPENLPTNSQRIGTIREGDIMLYGSNCLVLFYETFSSSYSYTKIGRIKDATGLDTAVGYGSVTISFDTN